MTFKQVLVFLFLFGSLIFATDITDCTNITTPGAYALTADILDSTTNNCIDIQANNTVLDCQWHTIDGDDLTDMGIRLERPGQQNTNVTIQNCILTDWKSSGIYLHYARNFTIQNIIATSNYNGIETFYSYAGTLENITSNVNSNGIYVLVGTVNLYNSNLNGNGNGLYLAFSTLSTLENVTISDNTAFDIMVSDNSINHCKNLFTNVTGTGSKPILFINTTVNFNGWNNNVSEIIFCNSDNSVIDAMNLSSPLSNNGIIFEFTNNLTIKNSNFTGMRHALYIEGSTGNNFTNLRLINNQFGVWARAGANGNYLSDSTLIGNVVGWYANPTSTNNTLSSNQIINSSADGIVMRGSDYSIYNNYFKNNLNIYFWSDSGSNFYNVTNYSGTNIIGGYQIGGNYWAKVNGKGYSQNCTDVTGDGFCDVPYNLTPYGVNVDYLPLKIPDIIMPTGSILTPPNGTKVNGQVPIIATVADNYGIESSSIQYMKVPTGGIENYISSFSPMTCGGQNYSDAYGLFNNLDGGEIQFVYSDKTPVNASGNYSLMIGMPRDMGVNITVLFNASALAGAGVTDCEGVDAMMNISCCFFSANAFTSNGSGEDYVFDPLTKLNTNFTWDFSDWENFTTYWTNDSYANGTAHTSITPDEISNTINMSVENFDSSANPYVLITPKVNITDTFSASVFVNLTNSSIAFPINDAAYAGLALTTSNTPHLELSCLIMNYTGLPYLYDDNILNQTDSFYGVMSMNYNFGTHVMTCSFGNATLTDDAGPIPPSTRNISIVTGLLSITDGDFIEAYFDDFVYNYSVEGYDSSVNVVPGYSQPSLNTIGPSNWTAYPGCEAFIDPLFVCDWNSTKFYNDSLGYDFKVVPCDINENCNESTVVKNYILDTKIPFGDSSIIYRNTDGAISAKNGDEILIRLNMTDGSGAGINTSIEDLTLINGTGNTTMNLESGSQATGQYSVWNLSSVLVDGIEGINLVNYYVRDNATPDNNILWSTIPMFVDNVPPTHSTVIFTNPTPYNNTNDSIMVTVSDNFLLDSIVFSHNLSGSWTNQTFYLNDTPITTYEFEATTTVYTGTYGFKFYIYDNAGNLNETATSILTVGPNAPQTTVNLMTPTNGQTIPANPITFSFNYSTVTAVLCTLYIDDTENETFDTPPIDTPINTSMNLSDGSHTWFVTCIESGTLEPRTSSTQSFFVGIPPDTCTYLGSGDWYINPSDGCNISINYDLGGSSLFINGTSGTTTITSDISNIGFMHVDSCIVRLIGGHLYVN